jgi:hypothetical protein
MRTRLHLLVAFLLLGGLVALGAFLPGRIAERFDVLLLDKVELQELAADEERLPVTTPLINRIKLLAMHSSEVLTTRLETGGRLNSDTVRSVFDRELDELRSRGLYPTSEILESSSNTALFSAWAVFCVVPTQPELNAVIWELRLVDTDLSASFYFDDESEKIISYEVNYKIPGEPLFSAQSGEEWLAYLGLPSDGLQITQEEINPPLYLEDREGVTTEINPPEEGISSVEGKIDSAVISSSIFINRFKFAIVKGTSTLDFFCEQRGDEGTSQFVLVHDSALEHDKAHEIWLKENEQRRDEGDSPDQGSRPLPTVIS